MLKLNNANKTMLIRAYKDITTVNYNVFKTYSTQTVDISFFGKTYKWNIKKNILKLTFNRAHKTWIFFYNVLLKKLSKNKIRLFSNKNSSTYNFIKYINKTRKNNIFTQRGLKIKNTFMYKKRGKISTYK